LLPIYNCYLVAIVTVNLLQFLLLPLYNCTCYLFAVETVTSRRSRASSMCRHDT